MKISFFTALFVVLFLSTISGQDVSTLLSDQSREFAAMHWHPDGRIYSIDYFNGRLYQIYLDGTVETLLDDFDHLAGGGFDLEGNFYFSEIHSGNIIRFHPEDNSYTTVGSGFKQPVGILASLTHPDTLYISEYETSKITKLCISTGQTAPFVANSDVFGPDAIIYDWDSTHFLVSNWNNHNIIQVTPEGTTSIFAEIPDSGFMGYVNRIGDFLYVPSFSGRKLYRVDRAGNVTHIAGTGGLGLDDGPGDSATFVRPNGTCHSPTGDTLLVSDHYAIRIITSMAPVPTSIEAGSFIQEATLSPNPAGDLLNISFQAPSDATSLPWTVVNHLGQEVQKGQWPVKPGTVQTQHIDISALANGNYMLQLMHDNSGQQHFKFVVQH
ncbi:MAG: T9SS type A sorting domain-containing protein [Bacteroidota bacterium]